jgi:hypothetical protein
VKEKTKGFRKNKSLFKGGRGRVMSLPVMSKRCEIAKTSREVLTGRALLHR